MSILNTLYLLNGEPIKCRWSFTEDSDGVLREVFTTELNDSELFGLCNTLAETIDAKHPLDKRRAAAIRFIKSRENRGAVKQIDTTLH